MRTFCAAVYRYISHCTVIVAAILLLGKSVVGQSENVNNIPLSVNFIHTTLKDALSVIEQRVPFKFAYSSALRPDRIPVTLTMAGSNVRAVLDSLLKGTGVRYRIFGAQIVLQGPSAGTGVQCSGYIRDGQTGEVLIGASVVIPGAGIGVMSNAYGFYSTALPAADSVTLEVSYIGYKTLRKVWVAGDGQQLSFKLEHSEENESIGKLVVVNDGREDNIRKNQVSRIEVGAEMIAATPSASGQGDLVSSVEMLPGVQAGIDGTPGYFVRGGTAGQNLILLDAATLYNPSHAFGLVGIFNPPTVKRATLIKGGFPANYGDYVSSVLDVVMNDGNNEQTGGSLQLGNIVSGVTVSGPLKRGRSSYLISGRRSTSDLILQPLMDKNYFTNYNFYDLNAKLNFQISSRDRLLVSFYTGRDHNRYADDTASLSGIDYAMHFGNTGLALRWNHQYGSKLFIHTTAAYNQYHQFLSATQEGYFAQLYSGIRHVNVKSAFDWYASSTHRVNGGVDYLHQTLYPATLTGVAPKADSASPQIEGSSILPRASDRLAVFLGDDMKLGARWQMSAGIRIPYFFRPGVRDLNFEPRLSFLYLIDGATSVKLSLTDVHQYIHLVQSYNASFPAEIWIGSSAAVRPQESRQVAAGLFRNFSDNSFQASIEGYYKKMSHQLLYGGRDSLSVNSSLEEQLISGRGWSYGGEVLVRKNRGRLTGWLAYTLAYSFQQFDSLNEGRQFPFAYDRRHMLGVSAVYNITRRWKVSANLMVASGRAFSLSPDSSYILNPGPGRNPLFDNPGVGRGNGNGNGNGTGNGNGNAYGLNRRIGSWDVVANNYRLSPYNRLDISIRYLKSRKIKDRQLETEWIFSVYNVYARPNNSFVYRTIDPSTRKVIAKELPLIPVVPTITYSLKF